MITKSVRKAPLLPTVRTRIAAFVAGHMDALRTAPKGKLGRTVDTSSLDADWPAVDHIQDALFLLYLVVVKLGTAKKIPWSKDLRANARAILENANLSTLKIGVVTFNLSGERVSIHGETVRVCRCLSVVHANDKRTVAPKSAGVNMQRVIALLNGPKAVETVAVPAVQTGLFGTTLSDPSVLN